jgi:hypothetical protein
LDGKGGREAKRISFREGLAGEQNKRGQEVWDGRKTRGTEALVENRECPFYYTSVDD